MWCNVDNSRDDDDCLVCMLEEKAVELRDSGGFNKKKY